MWYVLESDYMDVIWFLVIYPLPGCVGR
jgi:hypothetical protein